MGDYYSDSGEDDWSVDDDDEEYQLLAPSKSKVPPVAPPKPIGNSMPQGGEGEEEEEEEEEEYDYYDDDEEGEYEEGDYYEDDEEYEDGEYDEEEYEEEEYEDEEEEEGYEDEAQLLGPQKSVQKEETGQGYQQVEEEYDDDDDDDDGWFDEDEDDEGFEDGDFEPEGSTQQGLLSKMGNATSNAISAVRKSMGRTSPQGGGYVKPPTAEIKEAYAPGPVPIKIQRNPTPLEDRIPKSMRSKNNKLDYKQIKGKLKSGAPTKRPLTGLHKPVHAKGGEGSRRSPRKSKPKSRRPPPGTSTPGMVKHTSAKYKGPKQAAAWVDKRKNLKQTNRPLTGLHKPVGAKQMTSGETTDAVNSHVPSRNRRNEGVVKGSKPKYERRSNAPKLQAQRKKLRKAPRDRPLTGYYQPLDGKSAPQGSKSSEMVESFVPKKKRPASKKPERRQKEGLVKGSRPTYKKSSGPNDIVKARGKLKKGPTPRPLTGYHQPIGGKKQSQGSTDATVNSFVPKPKSRVKERAAVKNI